MPKIMFRPNPTPPPFVPPTPGPTENLIHISPYPFDQQQNLQVSLSNLQPFSGYIVVEFGMYIESEGGIVIVDTIARQDEPIPTNFTFLTEYSSDEIEYFVLNVVMQLGVDNYVRLNSV